VGEGVLTVAAGERTGIMPDPAHLLGDAGLARREGTLMDGGVVNVPQSALANPKGEYIIEGYGVDPDIEVDNDPKSVLAGHDPQLERAVAELMKKLTSPNKLPGRPKDPVKAGN